MSDVGLLEQAGLGRIAADDAKPARPERVGPVLVLLDDEEGHGGADEVLADEAPDPAEADQDVARWNKRRKRERLGRESAGTGRG